MLDESLGNLGIQLDRTAEIDPYDDKMARDSNVFVSSVDPVDFKPAVEVKVTG